MPKNITGAVALAAALLMGATAHADEAPEGAAAPAGVTAPGAKVEKLAGDFEFTEGPASDAEGNVFFTDQPNDRILKWSVGGKLSTFVQGAGRSNGLSFDAKGRLLACADEKNQLWRIDAQGRPQVLVSSFGGKLLNGPNDIWVAPGGGIYFSDPFYKRPYWTRGASEQDAQGVYFLTPQPEAAGQEKPEPRQPVRVAGDLQQPNGLIGTPDGKLLYVADIGASKTYAYSIQPDGSLADKKLFCAMGSDGMTIDDEGHVYLCGQGVTVFDKAGRQVEHIAIDEGWTTNACFGGAERRSLFITAGKSLYKIEMRTRGVGSQ